MNPSMSTEAPTKQAQWQKLLHYTLGNQATWMADIGLKAGLFRAIAAHRDGIGEDALVVIALNVRRYSPQPSIFVRSFSAITTGGSGHLQV